MDKIRGKLETISQLLEEIKHELELNDEDIALAHDFVPLLPKISTSLSQIQVVVQSCATTNPSTYALHAPQTSNTPFAQPLHESSHVPTAQTTRYGTPSVLKTCIKVKQMGRHLVPTLMDIVQKKTFTGIITVEDLDTPSWDYIANLKRPIYTRRMTTPDQFGMFYKVQKKSHGYTTIRCKRRAEFIIPTSKVQEKPVFDRIEGYLDNVIHNPPSSILVYYVGPSLSTTFSKLLDSGPILSKFGSELPGIKSPYDHLGEQNSGTAFHREDASFWSANLTLFGWKAWIIIHEQDSQKFEHFFRQTWGKGRCEQFVRHHSQLISPSRLHIEGIRFRIHCTGPGDLMITKPGEYHAVVNLSTCYAISTNFLFEGPVLSEQFTACEDCGLYSLLPPKEINNKIRRPSKRVPKRAIATPEADSSSGKRRRPTLIQELEEIHTKMKENDGILDLPKLDITILPQPQTYKLALAIQGKHAMMYFFDLIKIVKSHQAGADRGTTSIRQIAKNIDYHEKNFALQGLFLRYYQLSLSRYLQKKKGVRLRLDTADINAAVVESGWSKSTFRKHQTTGNKLLGLCGDRDGLLWFIHDDEDLGVTVEEYLSISTNEVEIKKFLDLLQNEYTLARFTAAEQFQDSMIKGSLICFRGENKELSIEKLLIHEELQHLLKAVSP